MSAVATMVARRRPWSPRILISSPLSALPALSSSSRPGCFVRHPSTPSGLPSHMGLPARCCYYHHYTASTYFFVGRFIEWCCTRDLRKRPSVLRCEADCLNTSLPLAGG